jgi:hypothetical protein
MDFKDLNTTVDVAFRYGPFAFGIILVLIAAKQTRNATPSKLIWGYFGAGVGFMIISVIWWLGQPGIHVYEGTFHNLTPYERLSSDDLTFFYREELKTVADDEEQLHNVRFAFVKRGPLSPGETFRVEYRKKGGGKRQVFAVPLAAGISPSFAIVWDEKLGQSRLESLAMKSAFNLRLPFERQVFAAEGTPTSAPLIDGARQPSPRLPPNVPGVPATALKARAARPSSATAKPGASSGSPGINSGLRPEAAVQVAILQDPRSEVGSKIAALDDLAQYEDGGVRVLLGSVTDSGPVAATLLDLGRHSDAELASKARALLSRRNLVADVASALQSKDVRAQQSARLVLASMDPAQASAVLNKIPAAQRPPVPAERADQPLPTGTRQGDRYYVKATWDPASGSIVDCLTQYFNDLLVARRSMDDERKLMRNRRTRLVYGYSREQATDVASHVRSCGATASFVVPWQS